MSDTAILNAEERFTIVALSVEFGLDLQSNLDQLRCLDRKNTGVGFFSTVLGPEGCLTGAKVSSASNSFLLRTTGQLLMFDMFIRSKDRLDLEGVVLPGSWPVDFDADQLTET